MVNFDEPMKMYKNRKHVKGLVVNEIRVLKSPLFCFRNKAVLYGRVPVGPVFPLISQPPVDTNGCDLERWCPVPDHITLPLPP